ncbi:hypothetical protein D3C81_685260 [compost metagenome]
MPTAKARISVGKISFGYTSVSTCAPPMNNAYRAKNIRTQIPALLWNAPRHSKARPDTRKL